VARELICAHRKAATCRRTPLNSRRMRAARSPTWEPLAMASRHALDQEAVTGLAEAPLLRFEWCVGTGCVPAAAFSRLVVTALLAKRAGRSGTLTAHREQIGTMISGASDASHCTSRN
jgi:hypothetical protein